MNAGWTMNVDTTSTTKYVGIGTINPNRQLHLVGDMELNGSLFSSGNISLANSLSYFGWDIYSDANAYSLSETNVAPRFKIIPGGNVGIGNITPSERLDIDGKVRVRMINNDNALDSVLVSDGSGVIHYRDKSTLGDGTGSWTENVDTTSTTKYVGIGTTTPTELLELVGGDAKINGHTLGRGGGNDFVNLRFGVLVLNNNTTGTSNTGVGYHALRTNSTGAQNTAMGVQALRDNSMGIRNSAFGASALVLNKGSWNTAIGFSSLRDNDAGIENTAIGYEAGKINTNGNSNTFLGAKSDASFDTLVNATAIGANAIVSQDSSLILGDSADVGIGTSTPSQRLDVDGKVRIRMINNDNVLDSILVSDGSGVVHYRDKSSLGDGTGSWTENVDTTSTTKYVGIGVNSPLHELDVSGNINASGDLYLKNERIISNDGFGRLEFFDHNNVKHLELNGFYTKFLNKDVLIEQNLFIGAHPGTPTEKLDVDGQARIRTINNDNTLDSVLVSDGSGVLHYRELSSLPDSSGTIQGTDGHTLNIRATDEGTVAGNARGENSVDLQTSRTAATQVASGIFSTIGGGETNTASGLRSTVGGGRFNTASGDRSTAGGGQGNIASGARSTIGGGEANNAQGLHSTVGGGTLNTASAVSSTVGGGSTNTASGSNATVGGGTLNTASGNQTTVGGGTTNIASGSNATVGGGAFHTASGQFSSIVGGRKLQANSYGETVVGIFNTPSGGSASTIVPTDPIFIVGNGTAVGSESNAMTVLKNGKVGIGNITPDTTLHVVGNIKIVDGNEGVDKVLTSDANGVASWQVPTKARDLQQVTATTSEIETSTSYVDMPNMSLTTASSGEYIVHFNALMTSQNAPIYYFIINVNGVDVAVTERLNKPLSSNLDQPVSITYKTDALSSGAVIKIRYRSSAGSPSHVRVKNRILIIDNQ